MLRPGDFYFGTQGEELRTLLGSCVAITLWHPQRLMGGMCHYLLPRAPASVRALDGRYGDHALQLFLRELQRYRLQARDCEVKVFGGGNMFPQLASGGTSMAQNSPSEKGSSQTSVGQVNAGQMNVGQMNVAAADQLLAEAGFRISKRHVGLSGHRTVRLDLATGETWIRWQGD